MFSLHQAYHAGRNNTTWKRDVQELRKEVNIFEAQPHIISHKREKLTWHMNGIQFYSSIFTFQIITRERSIQWLIKKASTKLLHP